MRQASLNLHLNLDIIVVQMVLAPAATVIVPTVTPSLAARLLRSLGGAGEASRRSSSTTGPAPPQLEEAAAGLDGASVLRLEREPRVTAERSTWRRRRAQGDALVLLNDDSVVDPGYVERIAGALDPAPAGSRWPRG